MSSSILTTIQRQVDVYGSSIFIILGYIGNGFILIIFNRQRQNACGIYLFSSAIVNILYLTVNGLVQIFPYNYTNVTLNAVIFCKIFFYLKSTIGQVSKSMIILLCIDRYLITHQQNSFRTFSTPKRAKQFICFSSILWLIICIHLPIMYTINNGQCGSTGNVIYSTFFTLYAITCVGGIPVIVLTIFGYLAYRNIHRMHHRIHPIGHDRNNQNYVIKRKDLELLIIVIAEVIVFIITITPFSLIFLEMLISQYILSKKSIQHLQIEGFILGMSYFLLFVASAIPFYIYLITSKAFRRDFKQLIINSYRKISRQPVNPIVSVIGTAPNERDTRL